MKYSFKKENALVLLSGGQDSVTCLYWAIKHFKSVSGISFIYGQKHSIETDIAKEICDLNGISLKILDISFMKDLVISNLFEGKEDIKKQHSLNKKLPSTYVPYRNMVFLTLAAAWGSSIGARHLVTGVCQTDFSGYPDCRDVFIKSLQVSLNLATSSPELENIIHTPLMFITKAEEFKMAEKLGCLDIILKKTLTCYNGITKMNDYGMGCGECQSCLLRSRGFSEYTQTL